MLAPPSALAMFVWHDDSQLQAKNQKPHIFFPLLYIKSLLLEFLLFLLGIEELFDYKVLLL